MFFTKLSIWIKKHTLLTIIIGVIVVGGITTAVILFDGNIFKLNHDTSSISNDNSGGSSNNILQDGTYSCELMYDGKSLDNDEIIKAWLQKLATYESSIDVDKINISGFRDNEIDGFSAYIVKENNIVTLNLSNGSEVIEYVSYDVSNNQFNLSNEWQGEPTSNIIETIFTKSISIKQSKDSFTYGNFGFILIYPTIVNNSIKEGISINDIDIEYDKYTDLGDLVCKNKLLDEEKDDDKIDVSYGQYLGKYVGTGSEYASESYVELLENNIARININNCSGWSTYKGVYEIDSLEYTDESVLYIDSFSIVDGERLDMPDAMAFQFNGDNLFTLAGYLGSNNFDCGVSTTFIKQ